MHEMVAKPTGLCYEANGVYDTQAPIIHNDFEQKTCSLPMRGDGGAIRRLK
jgi:hypothetical protein